MDPDEEIAEIARGLYQSGHSRNKDNERLADAIAQTEALGLNVPDAYTVILGVWACEELYSGSRRAYEYYRQSADFRRVRGRGVTVSFEDIADNRNLWNRSAFNERRNLLLIGFWENATANGQSFKRVIEPLVEALSRESYEDDPDVSRQDFNRRIYRRLTERISEYKRSKSDLDLVQTTAVQFFNRVRSTIFR